MSRKVKYTKGFKLKAVESVLKNGHGIIKVSDRLGINKSDLKKWIKYYQEYGLQGLTPKTFNTVYTVKFKLKVIASIEQKGLSFREASLKYNIPSHSTVSNWYEAYQYKGKKGLTQDLRGRPPSIMSKRNSKKASKKVLTREQELLQENESLKAELALLKKLHALAQAKKKKQ